MRAADVSTRFLAALAGAVWLLCAVVPAAVAQDRLPPGAHAPARVNLSVRILDITKIQETSGEASVVLEHTQGWVDPSLGFDTTQAGAGRKDYLDDAARDFLKDVWSPRLVIENQVGEARSQKLALSVFANGDVTLISTVDGDFRVAYDLSAFPFDTQAIAFSFASKMSSADDMILLVNDRDREISSVSDHLTSSDWQAAGMRFSMSQFYGWNARPFARVVVATTVERAWPRYVLRIFVPFIAVISVSLFILWAPRSAIGDVSSITYSALLALAALSFTFESSFPGSMSVTSPIAFMIALGYFYLIVTLLADLVLDSANFPGSATYPFVADECRRFIRVVLPAIFLIVCVCTILRSLV